MLHSYDARLLALQNQKSKTIYENQQNQTARKVKNWQYCYFSYIIWGFPFFKPAFFPFVKSICVVCKIKKDTQLTNSTSHVHKNEKCKTGDNLHLNLGEHSHSLSWVEGHILAYFALNEFDFSFVD
jgi:hypothetical protein